MAKRLVKMSISKKDISESLLSLNEIYRTREDENGALMQMIRWFKDEYGRSFSIANMKLGDDNDAYIVIYYYHGVRYEILKDGSAHVDGADADDDFSGEENDLKALVDGIIGGALTASISKALTDAGINVTGVRCVDEGDNKCARTVIQVAG